MAVPSPPRPSAAGFQLRTVIGLAFALILLASGGALVWLDQRATLHLLQKQIDDQFDVLVKGAATQIGDQFDSGDVALNTLALSPPSGDPEAIGLVMARVLANVVASSPAVRSLVTARADGRYIIVEHTLHELRDGGPGRHVYTLLIGEVVAGQASERAIRLDETFAVVSRAAPVTLDYDPRQRPWYVQAVAAPGAVTTPLYRFRNPGHYGFSIGRRTATDPTTVFGLDIRLDSLSLSLRRALVFGGEHVVVFAPDGALLGDSTDPHVGEGGLQASTSPRGPDERSPSLTLDQALYAAYLRDPTAHDVTIEVGGRALYANIAPVAVNGTPLVIASTVPADLFEGPATQLLLWSLAVQAAVMAVGFVLVDVAARSIARPIRMLAADVEDIIQFRFPTRPPLRPSSRIREIQRLLGAVDTLELTLRSFSTYMPQRFVRAIVDRGEAPALGGRREPLIVMFTDVEGFTGLSETMAPDALMAHLSRYFTEISDEILSSGGTVDKFIGDSIMAFWPLRVPADTDASVGVPSPGDGDRAAAVCRSVLRACVRLDALNACFAAEGRPVLKTRFGIHVGDAMVGSVGTADRMNYTALGHAVNVASRIEQLNKLYGTRVLVSAAMRDASGDGVRFRHVDAADVRGTQDRIDVYELLPDD